MTKGVRNRITTKKDPRTIKAQPLRTFYHRVNNPMEPTHTAGDGGERERTF